MVKSMLARDNIAFVIVLLLVAVVAAGLVGVGYALRSDYMGLSFTACETRHSAKTCECVPRVIAEETTVFQFIPLVREYVAPLDMRQTIERAIEACQ